MVNPGVVLSGRVIDTPGTGPKVVTAALLNYGTTSPLIVGDSVLAQTVVSTNSLPDGTWSLKLFGNEQIIPAGTIYSIFISLVGSSQVLWCKKFKLVSGTYDLSNLTPLP
jgi:hypothetical protein